MKKILIYITLLTYASLNLHSNIKPQVDYSIFKLNNDSIKVDIYYNLSSNNLAYIYNPQDTIFEAKIIIDASISSQLHNYSKSWTLENKIQNIDQIQTIFGTKSFTLKPAQYKIKLNFKDQTSKSLKEKTINIIPSIAKNKSSVLSDITYAYQFVDTNENISLNKEFLKGGYYLIPNASKEFNALKTELLTYFEIHFKDTSNKSLKLHYKILDAKKVLQFTYSKKLEFNSKIYQDFENIPISYLPTGLYYLKIDASVNSINTNSKSKKFYIYNPDIAPNIKFNYTEDVIFESSVFATMNKDVLKDEFSKTKYILDKDEIDIYESLQTHLARQRAIFKFWKSRDIDTTTFVNEKRELMLSSVRYANKHYSISDKNSGWKTDRGRILLKYGFPTNIDKFQERGYKNACEIWHYDKIQGGTKFYFVDNLKNSNFRLVHSTMINEFQDFDWVKRYNPAIESYDYMEMDDDRYNQNNQNR